MHLMSEVTYTLVGIQSTSREFKTINIIEQVRRIKDVHLAGSLQFYEFLDLIKMYGYMCQQP